MNQDIAQAYKATWQRFADLISSGTRLLDALAACLTETSHPELKEALRQVIRDIEHGATFHGALAKHPALFSRPVVALAHAGEVGGVLDVAAREIVAGLEDGACPVPGTASSEQDERVRFWRLLGMLLTAGVPILEAMDVLAEEAETPLFAEAARTLRSGLASGRTLAAEMAGFPDLFSNEVREIVATTEQRGNLARQALYIADALKRGAAMSLNGQPASSDGGDPQAAATVNQLLLKAIERHASDIHLDPTDDRRGRVRLRIDGVLHDIDPVPAGLFDAMMSCIKAMAGLDVAERRLPQDGRIVLRLNDDTYDFRVCVVPSVRGERAVIRVLASAAEVGAWFDLSRILADDDLESVKRLCHLSNGLIICAGPIGSGKTTLMYAMLKEVTRDDCCVMSIEDPVEVRLDGVTQIPVQPRIGLTFAVAARAVLRQDPDVIMIGELRDLETAEIAVTCARTGHLVLTQIHAPTCAAAIRCLLDMGLPPFTLSACLSGVIAQRLARRLCPQCRQPIPFAMIPPEIAQCVASAPEPAFYAPKGCDACSGGYKGRLAIYEILPMNDRVAQAVMASATVHALHEAALAAGMRPLHQSGIECAARGVTSLEEVLRVVPSTPRL